MLVDEPNIGIAPVTLHRDACPACHSLFPDGTPLICDPHHLRNHMEKALGYCRTAARTRLFVSLVGGSFGWLLFGRRSDDGS